MTATPPTQTAERLENEDLRGRFGPYHAAPQLIAAANTAIALGMPLLLTGEPGCGKTDFASVVAHGLRTRLFECYVRSDTRARDLLYSYDALGRFGDAQTNPSKSQDPRHYVRLKGLGLGLLSPKRTVVLIDEIDKAPRDLPNDLLRELDSERGEFEIAEVDTETDDFPYPERDLFPIEVKRTMQRPRGAPMPVVIVTSNAERQLPDAFLRRCVFFHIRFPGKEQLTNILRERFKKHGPPPFVDQAVDVFLGLRETVKLTKNPSTSEFINWFQALTTFHSTTAARALAPFVQHLKRPEKDRGDLGPAWSSLPELPCLIKLREDLERLG